MLSRVASGMVIAALAGIALVGCVPDPTRPAIFDRPQTSADVLPPGVRDADLDPASSRYVGEDSDGDDYWVARRADDASSFLCVVYQPGGRGDDAVSACGGIPLSLTTASGKVVELPMLPLGSAPPDAELIGATLLVRA